MSFNSFVSDCKKNPFICLAIVSLLIVFVQNYVVDLGLSPYIGFDTFMNSDLSGGPMEVENNTEGGPAPVSDGDNVETPQSVENLSRTPSTCYPQPSLTPEDLLPSQEGKAIQEFNIAQPIGEGILADVNLLDSGSHIGINTVGQSLRNANLQLRSEPPNPQVNVSPWMNTTIGPDLPRRPLEVGESCSV